MDQSGVLEPVAPGEAVPEFSVPAITRDGDIGLGDYRGRSPLMLGLFRGVYCPFCRRHIAMLDAIGRKLRHLGIETLAIVTTPVERARTYFRYRPTKMTLASDPAMSVHRALRLPSQKETEGPMQWPHTVNFKEVDTYLINPGDELAEAVPASQAGRLLDRKDGFTYEAGDSDEAQATWNQLGGLFLIDADGIVRWAYVEAMAGPADIGAFPKEADILAAATTLTP